MTPCVNVTTVRVFSACAVSEEKADPDVVDASGVSLNFGQRVTLRFAWEACTIFANAG